MIKLSHVQSKEYKVEMYYVAKDIYLDNAAIHDKDSLSGSNSHSSEQYSVSANHKPVTTRLSLYCFSRGITLIFLICFNPIKGIKTITKTKRLVKTSFQKNPYLGQKTFG